MGGSVDDDRIDIESEAERIHDSTVPLAASHVNRGPDSLGTEGEALRWYGDAVLVSEGDLLGQTRDELCSLHFRRDRDWLHSDSS